MKTAFEFLKSSQDPMKDEERNDVYMTWQVEDAMIEFAKTHIQQFAQELNLSTDYRKHLVDNYIKKSRL
jgi:hypothetical protein